MSIEEFFQDFFAVQIREAALIDDGQIDLVGYAYDGTMLADDFKSAAVAFIEAHNIKVNNVAPPAPPPPTDPEKKAAQMAAVEDAFEEGKTLLNTAGRYHELADYANFHNNFLGMINARMHDFHRTFMCFNQADRASYLIAMLRTSIATISAQYTRETLSVIEKKGNKMDDALLVPVTPGSATVVTRMANAVAAEGGKVPAFGGSSVSTLVSADIVCPQYTKHNVVGNLRAVSCISKSMRIVMTKKNIDEDKILQAKMEDRFFSHCGPTAVVVQAGKPELIMEGTKDPLYSKFIVKKAPNKTKINGVDVKLPSGVATGTLVTQFGQYADGAGFPISAAELPYLSATVPHASRLGIFAFLDSTNSLPVVTEKMKAHYDTKVRKTAAKHYDYIDLQTEFDKGVDIHRGVTATVARASFDQHGVKIAKVIIQDTGVTNYIDSMLDPHGNVAFTLLNQLMPFVTGKVVMFAGTDYLPCLRYANKRLVEKKDVTTYDPPLVIMHDDYLSMNKKGVMERPDYSNAALSRFRETTKASKFSCDRDYPAPTGESGRLTVAQVSLDDFLKNYKDVTVIDLYTPGQFIVATTKEGLEKKKASTCAYGAYGADCSMPSFPIEAVTTFCCYVPLDRVLTFVGKYLKAYGIRFCIPSLPFCFGFYVIGSKNIKPNPSQVVKDFKQASYLLCHKFEVYAQMYNNSFIPEFFVDRHLFNLGYSFMKDTFGPIDFKKMYDGKTVREPLTVPTVTPEDTTNIAPVDIDGFADFDAFYQRSCDPVDSTPPAPVVQSPLSSPAEVPAEAAIKTDEVVIDSPPTI